MRYATVCSGIEAPSQAWHGLGWTPVFFSEIEKHPSRVLAHHYPRVPNYGDMTKFTEWPDHAIDLLAGGTPCQSFSVAGLRKGLADPRGNLTLTFLAILARYRPQFVVWENVPGILSDSTGALRSFLDGLEELGYIIDIDILDAQYFGLAQRRRRVFVCGQSAKSILKVTTISSALTILQCLAECLLLALIGLSGRSMTGSENLGCGDLGPLPSLRRRMKLFGLDSHPEPVSILEKSFHAIQESSDCELGASGWENGSGPIKTSRGNTRSLELTASKMEITAESQNTAPSWRSIWAGAFSVLRESTTSTAESETIGPKIYFCAQAMLSIAGLITRSPNSSPCFWSAASSSLTALEAFIDYARSTTSDLFGDLGRFSAWGDFLREAVPVRESLANLRTRNFGEILLISESLRWNPPPRRETRQSVAPTIASRPSGGGGLGTDFDCDGGLIAAPAISPALKARDYKGPSSDGDGDGAPLIAHSLRASGFDASEDGTGRGTPIVPVVSGTLKHGGKGTGAENGAELADKLVAYAPMVSSTLRAGGNRTGGDRPPGTDVDTADTLLPYAIQGTATRENPASGPDGIGVRQDGASYTLEARQEVQAIAFNPKAGGKQTSLGFDPTSGIVGTLEVNHTPAVVFSSKDHGADHGGQVAIAFNDRRGRDGDLKSIDGIADTLHAAKGQSEQQIVATQWAVRRLTPLECLRLMGFPDDYFDGIKLADGNKYKMLGNSIAVNCLVWLGQRIQAVEDMKNA